MQTRACVLPGNTDHTEYTARHSVVDYWHRYKPRDPASTYSVHTARRSYCRFLARLVARCLQFHQPCLAKASMVPLGGRKLFGHDRASSSAPFVGWFGIGREC